MLDNIRNFRNDFVDFYNKMIYQDEILLYYQILFGTPVFRLDYTFM